jgi:cytochrome c553
MMAGWFRRDRRVGFFGLLKTCFLWCMLAGPFVFSSVTAAPKSKGAADSRKAVASAPIKGDPVAGQVKAESERCLECHGSAGEGQGFSNGTDGKFARLAGQYPEYIIKQMEDFRAGKRKNDFMTMMANSIDNTDLADIAAYFASQKKMQPDSEIAGDSTVGKNLFINGDAARNVVACVSCHGVDGRGIAGSSANPVIGGQGLAYLESQLFDWRSGARSNSVGGVMNMVTKSLTDEEIRSLAKYTAGLGEATKH